jgi:nucleoside-diphosphate-sugar epimerase
MRARKVLIIGGAGYVGSLLTARLLEENYKVVVLDTFWYGDEYHKSIAHPNLTLFKGDMRNLALVEESMNGCTDVIHLACISNDPSFDLDPALGKSINLDSFAPIVHAARRAGVERFIYGSSSSVYGIKSEESVTEELSLEPLTDYSRFKAECEEILLNENLKHMTSVIVRPATICGVSPRQRLDLVVNILAIHALEKGKIIVFGGKQFRPNLHINDMVRSYSHLLKSDPQLIDRKIYNIGGRNLTLDEIAAAVKTVVGEDVEISNLPTNDLRSYRVDSSKIGRELGFVPNYDVVHAVEDLKQAYSTHKFLQPLSNPIYTNIKRMQELNLG